MGYYNVVRPCVVGKLHYVSIPSQPIEVDDDVAAPLVESGDLVPYAPGSTSAPAKPEDAHGYLPPAVLAASKPETDDNKPRLVAWLLDNGTELSGPELNRLTKAELWDLINAAGGDAG